MKIALDIRKSIEKNAEKYFEKSKKARKKLEGARKALDKTRLKLEKTENIVVEKPKSQEKLKKREWYEKFHWFVSSDGFLVIGGRDATTNEIVVKKHAEPKDIVFHTDMAGSPFIVIKSEGKEVPEKTLQEASDFTFMYSRAWKAGLGVASVFHVKPDQVSKKANSGEFLPRGAFMIYGETKYIQPRNEFGVGFMDEKGKFMGGPLDAVKKHCKKYSQVIQGSKKPSDVAKILYKEFGGDLDEIIRALPSGGVELK